MFTRDKVTLRPVDWPDREQMYLWHCDSDLEIASGWGPRRSPTTYDAKFQSFLQDPPDDMVVFAIEAESELVGRIELAQIDREHRNASVGFFIGAREMWGQGIGTQAVIILVDYAFNVENLERVYAHTYSFNQRSRQLLRSVGFVEEGVLRKHEFHNGAARDMVVHGLLAEEFRERHETLFRIPQ